MRTDPLGPCAGSNGSPQAASSAARCTINGSVYGRDYRAGTRPRDAGHVPLGVPRVLAVIATLVGMRVLVARFFRHMISENVQVFWAALQRGG